jgi:hypothetical protein
MGSGAHAIRPALVAVMALAALVVATGAAASAAQGQRPDCFGAAARDPRADCVKRDWRTAKPTPQGARRARNAPCTQRTDIPRIRVCVFGAPKTPGKGSIALVGDSHATHWRGAVDVLARERQWRGLSAVHAGCPLSRATKALEPAARPACVDWNRRMHRWFARHPEVHTVFVSHKSGGRGVVPARGLSQRETEIRGYIAAWRALPRTVRHIMVIRDTPVAADHTARCVERVIRARRSTNRACGVRRSAAFVSDRAVAAARRIRSSRVKVIDLTNRFCDRRWCYPVIGGALVWKDKHHITATFAKTLGPTLSRVFSHQERR